MARLLPLELHGVGVVIDGKQILQDVTLTVAAHRTLVILGANGAGKSVLLRTMHGLLTPGSGSIHSASTSELSSRTTRRHDAMLFQRPVMLRRSALDNVRFGLSALDVADDVRRAEAALDRVGMLALAHQHARVLSGGEQQRVAFARALARAPELLYLDEPTASIDPHSTRALEALIHEIAKQGVTVVMVTHNLGQARRLADDIAFLHEGRLTEHTPAATFFREPQSAEGREYLKGESI